MGSKGDGVGEPADDGARGDDGVRSGRRRGAQGGPTRWRLVAAGTGDVGEAVLVLPRGSERYRVDVQADVGSPVVEVDDDPTADRSVQVSSSVGDARVQYAD